MLRMLPRLGRSASFAAAAALAAVLFAGAPAGAQENATKVPGASATASSAKGEVDVNELMAPGPLPDVVMGKADAPITIVEYASMTCGHCADFAVNTLPTIQKDYIDTGKAKLILREFPFDPRAVAGFMLARCAPEGRRNAMVEVLFQQQEAWAHAQNASQALLDISRLAGFTDDSFKACLSDKDLQAKVVATQKRGADTFGVEATPTFFINGKRYEGALPPAEFAAILDAAS
ncbi:DsbA family protein [Aureimonas leprariae]|uniref:DsbA family protein n=1 Tax=Plantimonas leprariae TaxID=2615207 RepID=A0A7V7TWD2_9HYPH|nr:DsbA family protein [Aureimonas leprariae]KAB0679559.1 DsbA family protein [Aureimonas leprariae]